MSMKIGITGARGFLGWHARTFLHRAREHEAAPIEREAFADDARLRAWAESCDAVVHLAGQNRGPEEDLERTNRELSVRLVAALESAGRTPQVVYANSTHAYERDTPYGRSKRTAAEILGDWAARRGARFTNLVIPHIFGECGRPHYNSAIATFCHQLAHGEAPRIIHDGELELVHAQEVARVAVEAIATGLSGEVRMTGTRMRVSEALRRLTALHEQYVGKGVVPPLAEPIELDLFNALRAALFPAAYPVPLELRSDARGALFEGVKTLHGGQCFISTTRPGVTRGNHYHVRKLERFLVLKGEAVIRVRRLLTAQTTEFRVRGDRPGYVDMPTLHTHNITNVGDDELVTLFWSHEIFDAARPDTYSEAV